jgi:hypothetical protein
MWDMRNVAAEKTMPLRLDPDPIRACPAPIRRRTMHSRRQRVPKPSHREAAEQMVSEFVGEEAGLSLMTSRDTTQKTVEGRGRKKRETADDLPPLVRNAETRRRRVNLAEATREKGLDRDVLVETLMEVLTRRRQDKSTGAAGIANDKLLLEVVRECARMVEAARTADAEAGEAARSVGSVLRLMHNIPRPDRDGDGQECAEPGK